LAASRVIRPACTGSVSDCPIVIIPSARSIETCDSQLMIVSPVLRWVRVKGLACKILALKRLPVDKNISYPFCTDGQLACPPEDRGGIPGPYDLVEGS
jgi:hypothetical protein